MPIYPGRRQGTLRIVVWAKGKAHEEIFEGTSKDDALEHEARMRIELRARGRTSQRIAPVFSRFCAEEYAPDAQVRLAGSTWRTREFILATLVEHFGALVLTEITTEAIDRFVGARKATGLEPS